MITQVEDALVTSPRLDPDHWPAHHQTGGRSRPTGCDQRCRATRTRGQAIPCRRHGRAADPPHRRARAAYVRSHPRRPRLPQRQGPPTRNARRLLDRFLGYGIDRQCGCMCPCSIETLRLTEDPVCSTATAHRRDPPCGWPCTPWRGLLLGNTGAPSPSVEKYRPTANIKNLQTQRWPGVCSAPGAPVHPELDHTIPGRKGKTTPTNSGASVPPVHNTPTIR